MPLMLPLNCEDILQVANEVWTSETLVQRLDDLIEGRLREGASLAVFDWDWPTR